MLYRWNKSPAWSDFRVWNLLHWLSGLPWWSSGWDSVLPNAGGPGSTPGRGTKIPHAVPQLRVHMLQLRSWTRQRRSHVPQLRPCAAKSVNQSINIFEKNHWLSTSPSTRLSKQKGGSNSWTSVILKPSTPNSTRYIYPISYWDITILDLNKYFSMIISLYINVNSSIIHTHPFSTPLSPTNLVLLPCLDLGPSLLV